MQLKCGNTVGHSGPARLSSETLMLRFGLVEVTINDATPPSPLNLAKGSGSQQGVAGVIKKAAVFCKVPTHR